MTGRHRKTRLKLASMAAGLCLAILLGEAFVRAVEPRPDTKGIPLPGSARRYGFARESVGYAGGVEFMTDSLGFRTCNPHGARERESTLVVVLGDSYAFGYGVRCEDAFPTVLQDRLQQHYPSNRIRVVNLAIPGYDTLQELATLAEIGPNLKPAVVLLAYHLNDIERTNSDEHGPRSGFKDALRSADSHFHLLRLLLPRMAALARSVGFHQVPSTASAEVEEYLTDGPAWRENQKTLKELFALANTWHWRLGVVVVPYVVDLTDRHPSLDAYQVVVDFCTSKNVPVVNAFDYFRGREARRLWINLLDGHPNAEGHVLIAKAANDLIVSRHLLE
jgi:lysophospholipase L1-like esterase